MAVRARGGWRLWAGVVLLAAAGMTCQPALAAGAVADNPSGPVRPMDTAARRLLTEGRTTCPTIARLAAALEGSDVIVMLSVTMVPDGLAGDSRFLATTATHRILHIRLDNRRPRVEQVVWLAHELQHAVEVAGAPEVRSGAQMAALMTRVGRSREAGRQFETDGAIACGRQAGRELAAMVR
jgi:hypothetical protein